MEEYGGHLVCCLESLLGVGGHGVPDARVRHVDRPEEVGRRLEIELDMEITCFIIKAGTLVSILQRKVSLPPSALQLPGLPGAWGRRVRMGGQL